MFGNGLKTIAVLACELQSQSQFQRIICQNISIQAYKLGYNVAIFNWNNPYGPHSAYINGQLEIFDLPDYTKMDAVIYLKDSFDSPEVESMLEERMKTYVKGPCVSIRAQVNGFYNILVDDAAGIHEIVKHFIVEHGCRKIAFMTGKIEMLDAQLRLVAYKNTMEEYGLEYDESYIFYGDYWKTKGKEAVDHFSASHYGMPEVIVCANDYMALTVMHELIERGYKIPDDILVSGFDNISDAADYVPSLTTLNVPFDKMGKEAVNVIHSVLSGESQEDEARLIVPVPVLRDSCGCHEHDVWESIKKKARAYDSRSDNAYSLRDMRFLTVALEDVSTMEEIMDVIDSYMRIVGDYRSFFICLNADPNGDHKKPYPSYNGYTDEMMCSLAIIDRVRDRDCPETFNKAELIPAVYTKGEPQIYYFTPLHFLSKNYGYTAISYSDYFGLQGDYYSFSTNISNALDSFNDKVILHKTLEELEKLYVSDPLTNLYNRRGFEIHAASMYEDCMERNAGLMIMGIDMDGLKYINDTHGHQAGDAAIQILAGALVYASSGKEVCARVGGDEFNVIASDYSEEEMNSFVSKVFEYLDNRNAKADIEYAVSASYGAVLVNSYDDKGLEYYINLCDKKMYDNKQEKKLKR